MRQMVLAVLAAAILSTGWGCHRQRCGGNCAAGTCSTGACAVRAEAVATHAGGHGAGCNCQAHRAPHHAPLRANRRGPDEQYAGPPSAAVAYPYYTTRGPRDFLMNNPPSIGR